VRGWGWVDLGLLKEVEQVLTWDVFEEEEEEGAGFEGPVEGDDVGVWLEGLVRCDLMTVRKCRGLETGLTSASWAARVSSSRSALERHLIT
jgi:hypothetical protein